MVKIYPSLISADILNLESVITDLEPYCDGWHIDIMDNNFVPNLTWGPMFANAIAKVSKKQLWVHLMVENPASIIEHLRLADKSIVSFHIETKCDKNEIISSIERNNWLPGIAISPKTPVGELFNAISPKVYQLLIMSVVPGFSGQKFMPETVDTLDMLVEYREKTGLPFTIGMDGGIHEKNLAMLVAKGVDHVAIASGIFESEDSSAQLQKLRKSI